MEYEQFVKNKSVALVGPAKYLSNSNLGSEIDEHDIVIRLNRGYEITELYKKDIGSRTDVLYSCLIERHGNAGKINPNTLVKKHEIKYIVAPPHSDFKGISHKTVFHNLVDRNKVNEISKLIPIRIVDHVFHTKLAQKVNCKPNTGFMAIYDILNHNPSTLSIYGFSFYLDGFMAGCKSGILEEEGKTEEEFADKCFNSKRHIQKNMWEYAKKTLLGKKNIRLDKTLNIILNLESFEKSLFEKSTNENIYSDKT
jgi:hypothetical protein